MGLKRAPLRFATVLGLSFISFHLFCGRNMLYVVHLCAPQLFKHILLINHEWITLPPHLEMAVRALDSGTQHDGVGMTSLWLFLSLNMSKFSRHMEIILIFLKFYVNNIEYKLKLMFWRWVHVPLLWRWWFPWRAARCRNAASYY